MIRFLLSAVALSLLGSPSVAADPPPPPKAVDIGVAGGMFKDVSPALVNVFGRPFRDLIRRDTGVDGEFKIYPDAPALAKNLDANQCQLAVFHGYEFAWELAKNADLVPLVVTEYHTGRPQACVVVHKDSKAATIADVKAEEIAIPKGSRGHCVVYVERFGTREAADTPLKHGALETVDALDAVVNGTIPAAVVDASALGGYEKLHPGAFASLRVLCKSDHFPQNVIAYKKGTLSDDLAAKLRATLVAAHTTAAGKPLMIMWNMKNFAAIPEQYTKQLAECRKTYPAPAPPKGGSGGQ